MMNKLSLAQAHALQARLNEVFRLCDVSVGVGLTRNGIAIRSQDERVDATNIGTVKAFDAS